MFHDNNFFFSQLQRIFCQTWSVHSVNDDSKTASAKNSLEIGKIDSFDDPGNVTTGLQTFTEVHTLRFSFHLSNIIDNCYVLG